MPFKNLGLKFYLTNYCIVVYLYCYFRVRITWMFRASSQFHPQGSGSVRITRHRTHSSKARLALTSPRFTDRYMAKLIICNSSPRHAVAPRGTRGTDHGTLSGTPPPPPFLERCHSKGLTTQGLQKM